MSTYEPRTFRIPSLEDISQKSLDDHLGLYQGYVKNFNAATNLLAEYLKDSEKNAYAIAELIRRRSFEWGGMRLHELYFAQWEGGPAPLAATGNLAAALVEQFGTLDTAVTQIKQVGMMRGPGWSVLYWDKDAGRFHLGFSEDQHMGHYASLPVLLALDVWEHAYLLDYGTTGKGGYIEAFFKNLNWATVEKRFAAAQG